MSWHDAAKIWLAKTVIDLGIWLLLVVLIAVGFGLYYLWLTWRDWKRKHRALTGYYICPDDWQGESTGFSECTFVEEIPPVAGESVFYRSGGALKPWGRR